MLDSVSYGFQLPDQSIGRSRVSWRLLASPTPGATNAALAGLGDAAGLRINEWLAAPVAGNSWFELCNTNALPVDMTGLFLTDTPSTEGVTSFQIPPLSFIGGREWVQWDADADISQGWNHVNFNLDALGKTCVCKTPLSVSLTKWTTASNPDMDKITQCLDKKGLARNR